MRGPLFQQSLTQGINWRYRNFGQTWQVRCVKSVREKYGVEDCIAIYELPCQQNTSTYIVHYQQHMWIFKSRVINKLHEQVWWQYHNNRLVIVNIVNGITISRLSILTALLFWRSLTCTILLLMLTLKRLDLTKHWLLLFHPYIYWSVLRSLHIVIITFQEWQCFEMLIIKIKHNAHFPLLSTGLFVAFYCFQRKRLSILKKNVYKLFLSTSYPFISFLLNGMFIVVWK